MAYRILLDGACVVECDTPDEVVRLTGLIEHLASRKYVSSDPVNSQLSGLPSAPAIALVPPRRRQSLSTRFSEERGRIVAYVRARGGAVAHMLIAAAFPETSRHQMHNHLRVLKREGYLVSSRRGHYALGPVQLSESDLMLTETA